MSISDHLTILYYIMMLLCIQHGVEGGKLKGRRDPQLQDRNMNTYKQTLTDNYSGI